MKNNILFLIVVFVLTNLSLYAFENDYFSVSDNGWINRKSSEPNVYHFTLKDFEKESSKNVEPQILVEVNEFNQKRYLDDDNSLLSAAKTGAKKSIELRTKIVRETFTQEIKKRAPSVTTKQIEDVLNKEIGTTEIEEPSLTMVDGHKAAVINFSMGYIKMRMFIFITLTKGFAITVTYTEPTSIDSIPEYDQFISSFNAKGEKATYYNAAVAPMIRYVIIFVIIFVIGLGLAIFLKKAN